MAPHPPPASAPPPEPPEPDAEFAEVDPIGRYGRYMEVLGKGAFKTVYPLMESSHFDTKFGVVLGILNSGFDRCSYKAFDQLEGLEVAWNQIKVGDLLRNNDDLERLRSEVRLLKTLKHKNIIKFYNSWIDKKNNNINFITEVFTSGTLRQYRIKHKKVDIRALKKWSRQILSGLLYLHSHDPPVIHRDLKCDNIFVNGNQGEVKIGDLGLATILDNARSAHSIIGTPEFMAPELYNETYNELVDIYAFGMCLLELVTFEYPYAECSNAAQIFKKVSDGEKPDSLAKVEDPEVKIFIEKCIAKVSERLPAKELLMDPFLLDIDNEKIFYPLLTDINRSGTTGRSNPSTSYTYDRVESSMGSRDLTDIVTHSNPSTRYIHDRMEPHASGRNITVESQRKDLKTIFLKLRIADPTGHAQNIHFPFDIEADTSISVATEMIVQLDLTDQDVTAIAEMIDAEILAHVPEWVVDGSVDDQGDEATHSDTHRSEADDELPALPDERDVTRSDFALEQLPSGWKYWSDSPKRGSEESPSTTTQLHSHTSDDIPYEICHRNENSLDNDKRREYHSAGTSMCSAEDIFERTSSSVSGDFSNPSMVDRNSQGASVGTSSRSLDDEQGYYSDQHLVGDITERLANLLARQQKELDELRKKHEDAIEDVLKDVPQERREETLTRCRLKAEESKL